MTTPRNGVATPSQAANYLGRTVQALAALRHRGRGPAYSKAAGRITYRWADLDAWLDEHKRTSTHDEAAQ